MKPTNPIAQIANFSVDPRLAAILGENYTSSERALRELVDNAWDAEAKIVRITLPDILTEAPIIVTDDGSGMKEQELRQEYQPGSDRDRHARGTEAPVPSDGLQLFRRQQQRADRGVEILRRLAVAGQEPDHLDELLHGFRGRFGRRVHEGRIRVRRGAAAATTIAERLWVDCRKLLLAAPDGVVQHAGAGATTAIGGEYQRLA